MAASPAPSPSTVRLAVDLVGADASRDPLTDELAAWLAAAPAFHAFTRSNATKIHKKLRTATDPEARRDVRAELLAARLLLADRRLELRFEAHGAGRAGPDFSAALRGERPFDVEVTRMRRPPDVGAVAATVLGKLRQLAPSVPNLLVIAVDGVPADEVDVAAATAALRARADARDAAFLGSAGFDGSRAFYDRYLRLGGVLVWNAVSTGDGRAALWVNRSARIALPDRVGRACLAAFRAEVA